jgi:hypothetical protein
MIFRNKNINPVSIKIYVHALHANTCFHKKFGTVLIMFNHVLIYVPYLCLIMFNRVSLFFVSFEFHLYPPPTCL